jgi:hypothetical protein
MPGFGSCAAYGMALSCTPVSTATAHCVRLCLQFLLLLQMDGVSADDGLYHLLLVNKANPQLLCRQTLQPAASQLPACQPSSTAWAACQPASQPASQSASQPATLPAPLHMKARLKTSAAGGAAGVGSLAGRLCPAAVQQQGSQRWQAE